MSMMHRLMNHEFHCSKYTVVHLVPFIYGHFSSYSQNDLMNIYNQLACDPMPQIRKQASIVLHKMIRLIPKVNKTEML